MCYKCRKEGGGEDKKPKEEPKEDSNTKRFGYTVGDFVTLKDDTNAKYRVTKKGVLCLAIELGVSRSMFGAEEFVSLVAFDDLHGDAHVSADPTHFRKATEAEVNVRKADCKALWDTVDTDHLETGDPVRLNRDVTVKDNSGPMGCGTKTIRKGTYAILDFADDEDDNEEESHNRVSEDSGRGPKKRKKEWPFGTNTVKAQEFYGPRASVYIPDQESEHRIPLCALERNPAECLGQKLVLPEGHMSRLTSVMGRVISADVAEAMYEKLKLHRVCSKGRGAIALLYGPPGVGKTMTAEVVAEMMGRSLIKLSLCATNSQELIRRLSIGFQRAKRYRSVLLLDEVDVFIRKRGGGDVNFDENTSVFLRMMEYYDGVLLMTTNLVDQIDPAVFSRVHVCLEYKSPGPVDRRAIWNGMLPAELKEAIDADAPQIEAMLTTLSEIPINGREIKTVIQNAVGKALTTLQARHEPGTAVTLPSVKWIPLALFAEEASLLHSQRSTLSR